MSFRLLMQCFFIMCLVGLQWVLYGYSLSFGPDIRGIIGSLDWAGPLGVGAKPFDAYSKTIPHLAFMIFQAMFAIITPALIVGAFAERIKFSAFALFTLLWATFVYDPVRPLGLGRRRLAQGIWARWISRAGSSSM